MKTLLIVEFFLDFYNSVVENGLVILTHMSINEKRDV